MANGPPMDSSRTSTAGSSYKTPWAGWAYLFWGLIIVVVGYMVITPLFVSWHTDTSAGDAMLRIWAPWIVPEPEGIQVLPEGSGTMTGTRAGVGTGTGTKVGSPGNWTDRQKSELAQSIYNTLSEMLFNPQNPLETSTSTPCNPTQLHQGMSAAVADMSESVAYADAAGAFMYLLTGGSEQGDEHPYVAAILSAIKPVVMDQCGIDLSENGQ